MENYCRAQQATDDNMAHAHYLLDTQGYKYTHSGCVKLVAFLLQRWLYDPLLSINVILALTVSFICETSQLLLTVFMNCGYTILPPPAVHFTDTDCASTCGEP